MKFGCQEFHSS